MNIQSAINEAKNILKKNNIKTSRLDSEILMSKAIKKEREYVLLNLDKNLQLENLNYFKNLIEQRSKGKPIAYLIGKKKFLEI